LIKLPDNYTVLFKNVKHIGIRVSHDQQVRIVVPQWLPEQHLENILRKREDWIQKHLHRLRTRKQPAPLGEHQILFQGTLFRFVHDAQLFRSVEIDEEHHIIRSGVLLMEKNRQHAWYRQEARTYIERNVQDMARRYGFQYNNIFIRSQKTRWGSCSRKKNLSFNWKLIKCPLFVIDYLILHELVHTEFMNHSKQYWQKVSVLCPEYKSASNWLKENGRDV